MNGYEVLNTAILSKKKFEAVDFEFSFFFLFFSESFLVVTAPVLWELSASTDEDVSAVLSGVEGVVVGGGRGEVDVVPVYVPLSHRVPSLLRDFSQGFRFRESFC